MSYKFEPYESLPSNCPPNRCTNITNGSSFYRLTKSNIPVDDDFKSHVALNPDNDYSRDLCGFSSVSLSNDLDKIRLIRKGPRFKMKQICKLILNHSDGLIINTHDDHFHWYRDKLFMLEELEYEII